MINTMLNDRYRIVRKVGSGGMAEVYEALDTKEDDKIVAIKVLKQEYSNDPQYLRRLTREAQAMVALKNEHVVSLYDMGTDGDMHYLVLEYVNGRTLREYMDEVGKLEPKEAVAIVCDVLTGLSHAHKMGFIHRDVKPQNIMMTEEGVIKLADFGIAKFAGSTTKTYDGSEAVGSVYYISPEQAKGERVDAQADIYSVGVMLYEMLAGDPPFSGENAVQVALKHINDDITPLHELDDRIGVALSDVVARATARDREVRYSTADEMRADLIHALKNPMSRFAKIKKNEIKAEEGPDENGGKGGIKEQLPHIAIIGAVVGVIAVFIVMFLVSMSKIGARESRVPNLLGSTLDEARKLAQNREYSVVVKSKEPSDEYSEGEICEQEPEAQTKAEKGTVILVTISSGNMLRTVPDLIGKTVDEAERALIAAELVLDKNIEYYMDNQYPVGTVMSQTVKPGESLMAGEAVSITVCGDASADIIKMPNLIGRSIESAVSALAESGITSYRIIVDSLEMIETEYANNTVISQNPSGGMDVIHDYITAEIHIFRDDPGRYTAQFSENINPSNEINDAIVVMLTPMGEVELYRGEFPAGTGTIAFTGHYWEKGSYTCIIYVNGEVYTTFTRSFE